MDCGRGSALALLPQAGGQGEPQPGSQWCIQRQVQLRAGVGCTLEDKGVMMKKVPLQASGVLELPRTFSCLGSLPLPHLLLYQDLLRKKLHENLGKERREVGCKVPFLIPRAGSWVSS